MIPSPLNSFSSLPNCIPFLSPKIRTAILYTKQGNIVSDKSNCNKQGRRSLTIWYYFSALVRNTQNTGKIELTNTSQV